MDLVDERVVGDAGRTGRVGVGRPELVRPSVSFSTKPSAARRRSSTGAVRQSRCTASQTSSPSAYAATAPWAFVQKGHWLSDEKGPAEELQPVVERLQHAERARRLDPVDGFESHRRLCRPASRRSSPAATAAETVCSKISSSEKPASFSRCTSASVTRYACRRTFSRYGAKAGGAGRSGLRGGSQLGDQSVVTRPHHPRVTRLPPTEIRPSLASASTTSASSSLVKWGRSAMSRSVCARRWRNEPSKRDWRRAGS